MSSSAAPPARAVLSLYSATLRASRSFSSYNFRHYFIQRAKTTFRTIQAETDPVKTQGLYSEAVAELAVLRRSAIVNQLYGGRKLAVETPMAMETETDAVLERSDT